MKNSKIKGSAGGKTLPSGKTLYNASNSDSSFRQIDTVAAPGVSSFAASWMAHKSVLNLENDQDRDQEENVHCQRIRNSAQVRHLQLNKDVESLCQSVSNPAPMRDSSDGNLALLPSLLRSSNESS